MRKTSDFSEVFLYPCTNFIAKHQSARLSNKHEKRAVIAGRSSCCRDARLSRLLTSNFMLALLKEKKEPIGYLEDEEIVRDYLRDDEYDDYIPIG